MMTSLLKSVVNGGTGNAIVAGDTTFKRPPFNHPAAGKTGTTNDNIDGWFVGYTKHIACGVWVGLDQPKPLGRAWTGGKAALPIWAEFMIAAHRDLPREEFRIPNGIITEKICNRDPYLLWNSECGEDYLQEVYIAGTEPKEFCECTEGGKQDSEFDKFGRTKEKLKDQKEKKNNKRVLF
jgi:penicillin-binding protein 2D